MGLRNYSSTVNPNQSASKMQERLAQHGARQVSLVYGEDGFVEAVSFLFEIDGRLYQFRLTVNVDGMLKAMRADKGVPSSYCSRTQARRTAWKNKMEWLGAQLAEIAANQASLEQLLLGYGVTDTGETFWDRLTREGSEVLTLPASPDQ